MRIAVAVGGATGWREDFAKLLASGVTPDVFVACNDAGVELDHLDHWCSLHPQKLVGENRDHERHWSWMRQRLEAGRPRDFVTWSHGGEPRTDRRIMGYSDGASGMMCVGIGLLFADWVVCCGIRMDERPNAFRAEKRWHEGDRYRRGWDRLRDQFSGRVFSMSGWTRRAFGAPPWLEEVG